jgi:hypothetical protein
MRNSKILLVVCLCLAVSLAEVNLNIFERIAHPFGGIQYRRETAEGSESIVELPPKGLFSEEEHFEDVRKAFTYYNQNADFVKQQQQEAILNCTKQSKLSYLGFFPSYIGNLNAQNTQVSFEAECFAQSSFSINFVDETTVELIHNGSNATTAACNDAYFFSTLINYHMEAYFLRGTHKTTFKVSAEEAHQIKTTGVFIYKTCDKLINFIPDMLKTALLFIGEIELASGIHPHNHSVPSKFDIEQSIKFIKDSTGYEFQERPQDVIVEIDESLVNSGDFFAVKKFDGTGNLVEYGTGSHVNHCTVALRVNGELYIAESNSDFEWPVGGIQINPYKTWVKWARDQGYLVSWVPLKPEFAKKFDENAAYDFFRSVEGLPYGIHNYIWGWLDTKDHSYPPMLAPEFFSMMFGLLEKSKPDAVATMFTAGLNMRLGTKNLSIAGVAEEAYNRNLTLPDLYAMVEQDGWEYIDGRSYVCSAFVAAILKAGGLFGDSYVNAVEFTPRDIYQLEFYDPSPVVPANCKAVDPVNTYCQIMGGYRIEFPGIGTIPSYPHMNEKCWSEPPLYDRTIPNC